MLYLQHIYLNYATTHISHKFESKLVAYTVYIIDLLYIYKFVVACIAFNSEPFHIYASLIYM